MPTDDTATVGLFQLYHMPTAEIRDYLEVPLTVVRDGLIADDLSLAVEYGKDYTLIPIENTDVAAMKELYRVYMLLTAEPTRYLYVLTQRADAVVLAVENLFGHTKYKSIVDHAAMVDLMAFHAGVNRLHEPIIVERPRIGAMYNKVVQGPSNEEEE